MSVSNSLSKLAGYDPLVFANLPKAERELAKTLQTAVRERSTATGTGAITFSGGEATKLRRNCLAVVANCSAASAVIRDIFMLAGIMRKTDIGTLMADATGAILSRIQFNERTASLRRNTSYLGGAARQKTENVIELAEMAYGAEHGNIDTCPQLIYRKAKLSAQSTKKIGDIIFKARNCKKADTLLTSVLTAQEEVALEAIILATGLNAKYGGQFDNEQSAISLSPKAVDRPRRGSRVSVAVADVEEKGECITINHSGAIATRRSGAQLRPKEDAAPAIGGGTQAEPPIDKQWWQQSMPKTSKGTDAAKKPDQNQQKTAPAASKSSADTAAQAIGRGATTTQPAANQSRRQDALTTTSETGTTEKTDADAKPDPGITTRPYNPRRMGSSRQQKGQQKDAQTPREDADATQVNEATKKRVDALIGFNKPTKPPDGGNQQSRQRFFSDKHK
ncbi:MAG: hypothetical protein LBI39_00560 [Puniceicoccales bacterium]|jgi:hypothetical protein|nr:hypothetical protein [Puniceicoccales bacterium]